MPTVVDEIVVPVTCNTKPAQAALSSLSREAASFSTAITGAFKSAVAGGQDFEGVLKELALRIAGIAFDAALRPVGNAVGGALAAFTGAFQGGGGSASAAGAGAAAASLPQVGGLSGAPAAAPAPVLVHLNVTTPDADSFRKSEAQVTAMLARAVGRGRRGL